MLLPRMRRDPFPGSRGRNDDNRPDGPASECGSPDCCLRMKAKQRPESRAPAGLHARLIRKFGGDDIRCVCSGSACWPASLLHRAGATRSIARSTLKAMCATATAPRGRMSRRSSLPCPAAARPRPHGNRRGKPPTRRFRARPPTWLPGLVLTPPQRSAPVTARLRRSAWSATRSPNVSIARVRTVSGSI